MKKYLLLLAFLSLASALYSQKVGIPYRVGNKFGVSDAKGKMLIPANYDIVEPRDYNGTQYLTAYTFKDGTVLSSLIYNNKIILDNKTYSDYFIINGLLLATGYKVLRNSYTHSEKNFSETDHLYDLNGKDVFTEDYKAIDMHYDLDDTGKLQVFLIYTEDLSGNKSLHLYDKKAKKITKTFIENAKTYLAQSNYDYNYKDRRITITYRDKTGKNKKMVLKIENGTIVIESDTAADATEQDPWDDMMCGGGDLAPRPGYDREPQPEVNPTGEKIILSARKAELKRDFYYLPKKIEEIKFTTQSLTAKYAYIVSKNGKQGLYMVSKKEFYIPAEYDEIIYSDVDGQFTGCTIVRNGSKYGAYVYHQSDSKVIAPVFDMFPIMVGFNYLGDKKPLFKLYDEAGKLFCYADENGKLFYKP
jgi:hypothetical protein